METKYGFQLMTLPEFKQWLNQQSVSRTIGLIQNHHTFLPDYSHFTGSNHFERLRSMKQYHMVNNNWSNIAQTFTTFPDGKVAVCRPLNDVPVGIKGHNSKGICIEHFGNFDTGKDQMTEAHRTTIVEMNAALCQKFALPADTDHIVYHHWYDLNSGIRTNGSGSTKSCPGTAFFGGNSVDAARQGFIPLILAAINTNGSVSAPQAAPAAVQSTGVVLVATLNIRTGPAASYPLAGTLSAGAMVSVYHIENGWARIAENSQWVAARYLIIAHRKHVSASSLSVRSGPGTQYGKLGSLPADSEVLVYEERGGWSRIDLNEKWVSSAYLV